MFEKISAVNSDISKKLENNLKTRVDERMNRQIMELLRSLKDPAIVPSKATLVFAEKLVERLFGAGEVVPEPTQFQHVPETSRQENFNLTLQEELDLVLQESESQVLVQSGTTTYKRLKLEFNHFRNTGERTELLQKLLDAFLSIKPTSTDVERVFSVCTNFCTKIRSRLSDKSLQALVLLKYYYQK